VNKFPILKRTLYIFCGIIALLLAYIGIIIPGFPAIPFIILAAYLFANSSQKIYNWMIGQRIIKKLMTKARGLDRRILKALMISQVWFSAVMVGITLAHTTTARVLTFAGGALLTSLILIVMKTRSARDHK
jgi:uncharacterized membrane protein YbaN (DUF454 family)